MNPITWMILLKQKAIIGKQKIIIPQEAPAEQLEVATEENDDLLFDDNLLEDEELSLLDEEEDNASEDNDVNESVDQIDLDDDDLFKL